MGPPSEGRKEMSSRLRVGYHASHEQFAPSELLRHVVHAEEAGSALAMSADHFHPWSVRQGQSGFSWAWLGAAMQATRRLEFGGLCVPGGWRYHPALVAQAAATLAEMFPGRLRWIGAGSGEALNERVVGASWPAKDERNARLFAGVDIIRALWRGETVTRAGPPPIEQATLFTRPPKPPRIYGAALTPKTAAWIGGWADGLLTTAAAMDDLRAIVDAFREGGGEGKPMALQVHLSWAPDEAEARAAAHDQWRSNAVSPAVSETLVTPKQFDDAAAGVRPEDMDEHVAISADPAWHLDRLQERCALGFDELHLHNVGRNQGDFIEMFGREVLPALTHG